MIIQLTTSPMLVSFLFHHFLILIAITKRTSLRYHLFCSRGEEVMVKCQRGMLTWDIIVIRLNLQSIVWEFLSDSRVFDCEPLIWGSSCVRVERLNLAWQSDSLIDIGSLNNSCDLFILRSLWNMSEIRDWMLWPLLTVLSFGLIRFMCACILVDRWENFIICRW